VILLTAVVAGMVAGWGYARWMGRAWRPPIFRFPWLVVLGFIPQAVVFYLPYTRQIMPDEIVSASLVGSQVILLVFSFANFRLPGMPVLAIGLGCNLAVILANGGFMPLTLEAAAQLVNRSVLDGLIQGERISSASKDILLPESQILLTWLADRFVPSAFMPYRFAFSVGDILVAAGAFWMLVAKQPSVPVLDLGVA
jgi:Family of unknown function (DUF5317)